jgi:ABC-type sugar transport system substrate-binding protein
LSTNPNLAAIYAINDPEAEGAVQALKAAGKNGVKDVFLVGFNGVPPAVELIKDGEMAATILQDGYGQGWLPEFANWVGAPAPFHISMQQALAYDELALADAGEDAVYYGTRLRGASNRKATKILGFRPRRLEWMKPASS